MSLGSISRGRDGGVKEAQVEDWKDKQDRVLKLAEEIMSLIKVKVS